MSLGQGGVESDGTEVPMGEGKRDGTEVPMGEGKERERGCSVYLRYGLLGASAALVEGHYERASVSPCVGEHIEEGCRFGAEFPAETTLWATAAASLRLSVVLWEAKVARQWKRGVCTRRRANATEHLNDGVRR